MEHTSHFFSLQSRTPAPVSLKPQTSWSLQAVIAPAMLLCLMASCGAAAVSEAREQSSATIPSRSQAPGVASGSLTIINASGSPIGVILKPAGQENWPAIEEARFLDVGLANVLEGLAPGAWDIMVVNVGAENPEYQCFVMQLKAGDGLTLTVESGDWQAVS